MSDSELPPLAQALLGEDPLAELLGSDELFARAGPPLTVIRGARAQVRWWGRNGDRVDLVVGSDRDEWRVVYFTNDGKRADELSVFRRPPRFAGIAQGVAVIVNGPSGAGKSSVLEQLAARSPLPWVVFDEPIIGAVKQEYLIWRDRAPVLHRGYIDALGALARRGNLVALSAGGHRPNIFEEAFTGVRVIRVGLYCDLATLLAREQERPDRWGGLVVESVRDHDGWTYDLSIDTAVSDPAEIADQIAVMAERH